MTKHTTRSSKTLTETDIKEIAADFAQREFTSDEINTIKKTRRRSPRIGDSNAEVVTFRAPPNYKLRIAERAHAEHTSESQVIRDALDAYL
ncbi:MAG: ribbon-helix-helix protein, CopG family [Rhodococcus sp. (in: high G+C Gram-positive bacteria)]